MASRQGRQPGMVQRSARSPGRSQSPRGLEPSLEREQELQKQLNELQKYKLQEEKEKKKEEALRKKELTAAKKRITKEVQGSMKTVKKTEQEVAKLQTTIRKLQGQESDVKKKTVESEMKFREKLQVTEVKHQDLESKLSQKYADVSQERIKLQQLQLQLDTLTNSNLDLSKPRQGLGALRDAGDSGRGLPSLHDSAVETTDAEGEERYAQAESEVNRLAMQLQEMRSQYEEAEEQRQALLERMAEVERGEAGPNSQDIHRECREAIEALRRDLDRLREENEGLHAKLGAANKALELQEECIEELAGRASGVGEGLMNIASQELARCSVIQAEGSRLLSSDASRRGSAVASPRDDQPLGVGDVVRLTSDSRSLREAFRNAGFPLNEQTETMLGKAFPVLEVPKQGVVGLPAPDGSQGGIWYFPMAALQKAVSQPPTPGSASATASTAATRDIYNRASASNPPGAQPMTNTSVSANSSMQARSSTPNRYSGFQGGGSGRPGIAPSTSSGSLGPTPYQTAMQTPVGPPTYAGTSVGAPECTPQPASPTGAALAWASAPSSSSATTAGVYVASIPTDLPEDQLVAEFAKYGVITDMQVQRDDSGPQKSYALLTYQTSEEAARAVQAASNEKVFLPGAAMPCEVGFARGAQLAGTQLGGLQQTAQAGLARSCVAAEQLAAGQQPVVAGGQQVIVYAVPNETPDDLLKAEFSGFGTVVDFAVHRDPSGPHKSYAVVTYQTKEDAARAVEVTNGRLVMPGATAPAQVVMTSTFSDAPDDLTKVGAAARNPQSAMGQVLTAGQLMSVRQQQARPHSAPRLRSGPALMSTGPGVGVMTAGGDVRRQLSGANPVPGIEVTDAEGGCAWAASDPRRFLGQWPNRMDASAGSAQELDTTRGRHGQVTQYELSASAGALHTSRPMMRQWPGGMPSEPVAGMAPGAAEMRQLSPCQRQAGAVCSASALVPGSHVTSAGALGGHPQLLQVPGQDGRLIAFRSPGPTRPVAPLASMPGNASPGAASPRAPVMMVPAPGAAWRGGPAVPMPAWPAGARQQVLMPQGPPSAHGSFVPPVGVRAAPPGAPSVPTAGPGMVPQVQVISPVPTAAGNAPQGTVAMDDTLSASMSRSAGLREAVSKVTAKALREYRQNHRVSLAMD